MDARRIPVSLRRDPREVAERHSQANPLTLYCELARGEEVTEALNLYAELHTSRTPQSSPVATAGPVAMAPAGTGPWELDFSAAQMNQTVLPGEDKEFWLVVYATGANDLLLTLGTIRLTLAYDNISQVTPAPPEPALILAFRTIAVAGQSSIVADTSADTLTIAAGNGVTLTTNAGTDTLTIAAGGPFTDLEVTGTLTAAHIHGNLAGSVYTHIRNESGGPLAKGTPVYVTGFSVGQSRPLVSRADAASASTMPAIGILDAELANNASGHCVITGIIENLDTSGLSVNAPLYVASGGGLTATAPDVRAQPVAIVERVNVNNGAIIVTTAGSTGSLANQSAANVAITGGSISGLSSLSAGTISVTLNTASTSTTTGALVVTGGVGIGGAVFAGANSSFNGVTIGRGGSAQSNTIAIGGGLAGNAAGGAGSTYVGNAAGRTSTGANNTLIGSSAGESVASGTANSVLGSTAYEGGSGSNNVIVGAGAARSIGAGDNNIIIGLNAGRFITGGSVTNTGSNNCVFIGRSTYPSAVSQTNSIIIGDQATGDGSNTTVIGTSSTISTRLPGGKFIVSSAASDSITTSGGIIASGAVSFTSTTASTSTTTGALVVTGGVGIGGAINTGADLVINGLRLGRGVGNATTNVAFGLNAGNSILTSTPSSQEVAIGNVALATAHSGSGNCAVGSNSMQFLSGSSSASNTSIGTSSLFNIATSSNDNVAAGANAGRYAGAGTAGTNTLCSTSVFIGTASRPAASGQTNQVVIGGLNAIGDGSNTTVIGTASTTQSRIYGGNALTTGANGQSTQLGQSTTASPTPTTSGATVTVAALIPANSIVIGVTARVTTAITGATSFDIGDGTTANIFGDDVAVALDTTSNNTIAPTRYATATNVVLTANGGNFTAGAVRLTVHFLTLVAPTS